MLGRRERLAVRLRLLAHVRSVCAEVPRVWGVRWTDTCTTTPTARGTQHNGHTCQFNTPSVRLNALIERIQININNNNNNNNNTDSQRPAALLTHMPIQYPYFTPNRLDHESSNQQQPPQQNGTIAHVPACPPPTSCNGDPTGRVSSCRVDRWIAVTIGGHHGFGWVGSISAHTTYAAMVYSVCVYAYVCMCMCQCVCACTL